MSDTKFTGGDWWVNPVGQHYNNPDIASYEICWSKDAECVVDHVYELADAHLIAAAPEMYELLDEVSHVLGHNLNPTHKAYIKSIGELLAKARGESV